MEVEHYVKGILHIVEWKPDTSIQYEKPLNHLGKRYFLFVREGDRKGRHRGWVLKQLSNGESESQDTLTINIGVYHAVFDALLWDCVMDTNYPYEDSNLWWFTYLVK